LSPNSHHRKGSDATSLTDVESVELRHVASTRSSLTHVDYHSPASPQITAPDATTSSEKQGKEKENEKEKEKDGKKKKGKKGDEADDGELTKAAHELELSQDDAIDPAPCHFKPFQLAHILNPKSLPLLTSLGGVKSLLRGLGVDADRGLSSTSASTNADHDASRAPLLEKTPEPFAGSEKLPEITLTEPGGKPAPPTVADYSAAFNATLEDSRLVFGENVLPTRASNNQCGPLRRTRFWCVPLRFLFFFSTKLLHRF
jgi:Ca2+-transporting ATPase